MSSQPATSSSTASAPSSNDKQKAVDELYKQGLQVRREVMGNQFVDRALANNSSDFASPIQEYITSACWGQVWTRSGLSRRDRSMLNLGMLCCLNRGTEFAGHVRGALNNGVTEQEISEVILQVAVYAGAPASLEGARIAEKVIKEWREERSGKS